MQPERQVLLMKPIKLIISSIGPYAGLMPEIDFERFEEQGLFLITGDTGAGKTMIFDAICYALYGETSGTYREKEYLRSEYADPSQKSFVDFYFSHQGKNYRVYREPAYEREKLRGSGTTWESENAILYIDGSKTVEKTTKVNEKIIEMLKIDCKQFKQIAMIAQGEFWQLLNANTEKRTQILRTIFETGGYMDIENKLYLRMKKNESEVHDAERSIVQYFDDVAADAESESFEEYQELRNRADNPKGTWEIEEMLAVIDALTESDNASLTSVSKEAAKTETELKQIRDKLAQAELSNKQIERVKILEQESKKLDEIKKEMTDAETLLDRQKTASREVNPSYVAWKTKSDEVVSTQKKISDKTAQKAVAEKQVEESKNRLAEAEKRKPEQEELKKLVIKINGEEAKYRQRKELTEKLTALETALEADKKKEAELEVSRTALNEKIESLQKTISDYKDKPVEFEKSKTEGRELQNREDDFKEILEKKTKERNKRQTDLKKKQATFLQSFEAYEKANAERIKAEKIIEGNKAGILAKDLQEGQECPVCGSVHHPKLAKLPETSVSEEEFESLKAAEDSMLERKTADNTAAEKAKTALEEYEELMRNEVLDSLNGSGFEKDTEGKDLDGLIAILKDAEKGLADKINENKLLTAKLEKECKLFEKAQKEHAKATGDEKEQLEARKAELLESNNKTRQEEAETRATLKTLQELSYDDWEKALAERKSADKTIREIEKLLEDSSNAKAGADKELAGIKAALDLLNENLKTRTEEEKECKTVLYKKLGEHKFSSLEEMLSLTVSEEKLNETDKKINEYKQALTTNKTQLRQAREDAKGKEFVDLEALDAQCKEQDKLFKAINAEVNKITNRMENNAEKKKNISEQRDGFEKSRKEYYTCKRLYELTHGTTRNGKITLEQFVQAAGFDGIIAAANRRLLPMSDQQFELFRQVDSIGKQSNNFLDLVVMDYNTGRRRPVGTLSGGESFKASLSLALGLSDTISTSKGGIQMDALFIDEGFGTLDKKSIDTAVEILQNLTGANKLVGVISHREELIEKIPDSQQIMVEKTAKGSKITFDS